MEVQARDDDGHGTYANPLCNMPTRNRTSLGALPSLPDPASAAPHCCTLLASLTLRGAGTPGDGFQCNVLYDKLARARFFAWCKERAITELYVDANGDAALRNATAGAALESFVEDSDKAGIDLQVRNIHVMLPSASPAVYFRVALLLRCGPAPSYDAGPGRSSMGARTRGWARSMRRRPRRGGASPTRTYAAPSTEACIKKGCVQAEKNVSVVCDTAGLLGFLVLARRRLGNPPCPLRAPLTRRSWTPCS